MKIGIIGDPHLNNHRQFGRSTTIPGVNKRLLEGGDALAEAIKVCCDHGANRVVVAGDLTHLHGVLTPPVLDIGVTALSNSRVNTYLLSGNHDKDSNGRTILGAFTNNSVFLADDGVGDGGWLCRLTNGYTIVFIQYMADYDKLKRAFAEVPYDTDVVITHLHFQGAVHGRHEFEPPAMLTSRDIPDHIPLVVSGHFHKRQTLYDGKVVYPGSILQHDFGEVDYTPSIMILDSDGTYEFVDLPNSPRFYVLDGQKILEDGNVPGRAGRDYYRVDYPSDVDLREFDSLRSGLLNLVFKPVHNDDLEVRTRIHELLEEGSVGTAVSEADAIDAWAVMKNKDEDRAKRLADLGRSLVCLS